MIEEIERIKEIYLIDKMENDVKFLTLLARVEALEARVLELETQPTQPV